MVEKKIQKKSGISKQSNKQKQKQSQVVNIRIGELTDKKKKKRIPKKTSGPSYQRVQMGYPVSNTSIQMTYPPIQPMPSFENRTQLEGSQILAPPIQVITPVAAASLRTPVGAGRAAANAAIDREIKEENRNALEKILRAEEEMREVQNMKRNERLLFSQEKMRRDLQVQRAEELAQRERDAFDNSQAEIKDEIKKLEQEERLKKVQLHLMKSVDFQKPDDELTRHNAFQSSLQAAESPFVVKEGVLGDLFSERVKRGRRKNIEMEEARIMGLEDKPEPPKRAYVRKNQVMGGGGRRQILDSMMTPMRPETESMFSPFQNTKDITGEYASNMSDDNQSGDY